VRLETPRWTADDFEIHVTASYSAAPDARALADTLLSEESLRGLTADLMNQVLAAVWSELPKTAGAVTAEEVVEQEIEGSVEVHAEPVPEETIPAVTPRQPAPSLAPAAIPFAAKQVATRVGEVLRMRPLRPQPWKPRQNPLSGINATPPFSNSLAKNPLEERSEARRGLRLLLAPR
jgi:hypothetical protein